MWEQELSRKSRALEALQAELADERRRPQPPLLPQALAGPSDTDSAEALKTATSRAKAAEEEARRLRLASEGFQEDARRREEALREGAAAREAEMARELQSLRRERVELQRAAEEARGGWEGAETALRASGEESMRRLRDVQEEAELRVGALREQLEAALAGGGAADVAEEEVRQLRGALAAARSEMELERSNRERVEASARAAAEGHARVLQELQEDAEAREDALRSQAEAARIEAARLAQEPEAEAVARLREEITAAGAALAAEQEARERAERAGEKARKHLMEREAEEEERDAYMATLEDRVTEAQDLAAKAQQSAERDEKVSELQGELDGARRAAAASQVALAEREAELQRLQVVLGQLSADSELLEAREAELEAATRNTGEARAERDAALRAAESARGETAAARQETQRALEGQVQLRGRCGALHEDTFKLKKALEDAYRQLKASQLSSGQMIDRQIVAKLLVTYFEREQAPEILGVMMGVLGLEEEQKAWVQAEHLRARKGLLKTVSRAPIALVKGGLQLAAKPLEIGASLEPGDATMGDMWLDFLTQELEAEEQAKAEGRAKAPVAAEYTSVAAEAAAETPTGGRSVPL